MSQSTHQSTDHKRQSQDKNQTHAYAKVWLYFMYYWMIFGIGCYFGQYLPMSWRKPLSIGLLILILATLFIKRARKYGLVISYIRYYCRFAFVCSFYDLLTKFRSRSIL